MKRKIKAALFDFDGVIATSPEHNFRAWQYAFTAYDCDLDKQEYFLLEGIPGAKQVYTFIEQTGLTTAHAQELLERKRTYYMQHARPELYPGIRETLHELTEQGLQVGLVSGGNRERIESFLKTHALNSFRCLISGDSVANSKPAADPYLHAAALLNIPAKECVVIENAPLGIQAAKAAGMYCIALAHTLAAPYLAEADCVLQDTSVLAAHVLAL